MLLGTQASTRLQTEFSGVTVHRRSVKSKKEYFADLHVRVRDALATSTAFGGMNYLNMLGQELGAMDGDVYQDVVDFFINYLTMTAPGNVGDTTVLGIFPGDFGLYARMTDTALYRSLRFMMCK